MKFQKNKKRICVIGPGIVGYATGKVLAEHGFEVGFIGRNEERIKKLKSEGFWAYTFDSFPNHSYPFDISIITVATPTVNGKIDLDPLQYTSQFLGKCLALRKIYHLVVVKSTVPPGTTEDIVIKTIEKYSKKKVGKDFGVCMNPEYLRAKTALGDSLSPWIILIGQYDKKSGDILEKIYKRFTCPTYRCTLKEAEMQKYVHNLFNALKITFFNEMREVGKKIGVNTERIFAYSTKSCEGIWNPRYGIRDFGPFDGSCLPKDTQAFLEWAKTKGFDVSLLEAAIAVNNRLQKNNENKRKYIGLEL